MEAKAKAKKPHPLTVAKFSASLLLDEALGAEELASLDEVRVKSSLITFYGIFMITLAGISVNGQANGILNFTKSFHNTAFKVLHHFLLQFYTVHAVTVLSNILHSLHTLTLNLNIIFSQ